MIYRRERSKCRETIEKFCKDHGWTLTELYNLTRYHPDDPEFSPVFWITGGLKTQLKKMIDEENQEKSINDITYVDVDGEKYPLMLCEEHKGSWRFYCPFCLRFHYHGHGEGHRLAHCHTVNSPFNKSGYFLKLEVK